MHSHECTIVVLHLEMVPLSHSVQLVLAVRLNVPAGQSLQSAAVSHVPGSSQPEHSGLPTAIMTIQT